MISIAGYGDFVKGFRMLGVKDIVVLREGEESMLERLIDEDKSLIIIDGRAFEKLKPFVKDKMITSKKPLFFVLHPEKAEDESLRLMIKRALGIEMESL